MILARRILSKIEKRIIKIVNFLVIEYCTSFILTTFIVSLIIMYVFRYTIGISNALIVFFTLAAALVAMLTFIINHRVSTIRYYTDKEDGITEWLWLSSK